MLLVPDSASLKESTRSLQSVAVYQHFRKSVLLFFRQSECFCLLLSYNYEDFFNFKSRSFQSLIITIFDYSFQAMEKVCDMLFHKHTMQSKTENNSLGLIKTVHLH